MRGKVAVKAEERVVAELLPVGGALRLLASEYGVEEEALELLVGQVDHQLLEAIGLEDLKAEDVEEPNPPAANLVPAGALGAAEDGVDALDG